MTFFPSCVIILSVFGFEGAAFVPKLFYFGTGMYFFDCRGRNWLWPIASLIKIAVLLRISPGFCFVFGFEGVGLIGYMKSRIMVFLVLAGCMT